MTEDKSHEPLAYEHLEKLNKTLEENNNYIAPMKILVCGDRNWDDWKFIYDKLRWLPPFSTVVNGACRGADKLSTKAANLLELYVIEYPADWNKYGKSAGPRRNLDMLKENLDEVWAFHDNIEKSKGTKDMIDIAKKFGVPVKLYRHE